MIISFCSGKPSKPSLYALTNVSPVAWHLARLIPLRTRRRNRVLRRRYKRDQENPQKEVLIIYGSSCSTCHQSIVSNHTVYPGYQSVVTYVRSGADEVLRLRNYTSQTEMLAKMLFVGYELNAWL